MGNLNGLELLLVREFRRWYVLFTLNSASSGCGVILRRGEIKCIALGRVIVAGCFKDEKGGMR